MAKKILVTGGAGFIGSNFVKYARAQDADVVTLDSLTYAGNIGNLRELEGDGRHRFIQGSINDRDLVCDLLANEKPDCLINFAAESHVDRSIDGPAAFVETNIVGVTQLLEAVRDKMDSLPGNFKMLQVSTDEVYGEALDGAFVESSPYRPNSPYAASKASADHLVRAYHRTYGLPLIITNCSNNYGPYQFPEKLIPVVIINALNGAPIPVYGDGSQQRDWLHVDDHCAALYRVLDRGRAGETYNVGGGVQIRNIDLVKKICLILDDLRPLADGSHNQFITFVEDRPGHDIRYAVDHSKISRELAWHPLREFDAGLRDTVTWYVENRDWWSGNPADDRLGLAIK